MKSQIRDQKRKLPLSPKLEGRPQRTVRSDWLLPRSKRHKSQDSCAGGCFRRELDSRLSPSIFDAEYSEGEESDSCDSTKSESEVPVKREMDSECDELPDLDSSVEVIDITPSIPSSHVPVSVGRELKHAVVSLTRIDGCVPTSGGQSSGNLLADPCPLDDDWLPDLPDDAPLEPPKENTAVHSHTKPISPLRCEPKENSSPIVEPDCDTSSCSSDIDSLPDLESDRDETIACISSPLPVADRTPILELLSSECTLNAQTPSVRGRSPFARSRVLRSVPMSPTQLPSLPELTRTSSTLLDAVSAFLGADDNTEGVFHMARILVGSLASHSTMTSLMSSLLKSTDARFSFMFFNLLKHLISQSPNVLVFTCADLLNTIDHEGSVNTVLALDCISSNLEGQFLSLPLANCRAVWQSAMHSWFFRDGPFLNFQRLVERISITHQIEDPELRLPMLFLLHRIMELCVAATSQPILQIGQMAREMASIYCQLPSRLSLIQMISSPYLKFKTIQLILEMHCSHFLHLGTEFVNAEVIMSVLVDPKSGLRPPTTSPNQGKFSSFECTELVILIYHLFESYFIVQRESLHLQLSKRLLSDRSESLSDCDLDMLQRIPDFVTKLRSHVQQICPEPLSPDAETYFMLLEMLVDSS